MSRLRADTIIEALERARHSDSQLVLLVGESPDDLRCAGTAAAAELGWPLIDLNLVLGERLLPFTPPERRDEAWDALGELAGHPDPGIVLVGTDILFEPTLAYRPYEALRRTGRRGPVLATWLGRVEEADIVRSAPGHPEYTRVRLDVPYVAVQPEGERR